MTIKFDGIAVEVNRVIYSKEYLILSLKAELLCLIISKGLVSQAKGVISLHADNTKAYSP